MRNNSEFDFIQTFPPLGHPEHHFNEYINHPWLKEVEDIKFWIVENCLLDGKDVVKNTFFDEENSIFLINDDLTVSVKAFHSLEINKKTSFIPIQFRGMYSLSCSSVGLKSLVGSPFKVSLIIAENNELVDLRGIKKESNIQRLFVNNNRIKDTQSIKNLKKMRMIKIGNNPIESLKDLPEMENLHFHNSKVVDNIYKLLLDVPIEVGRISIKEDTINDKRVKSLNQDYIDMDWLRKEQELNKKRLALKDEMHDALKINGKLSFKKRKV